MLDLINRYCHGYILLPALDSLKKRKSFNHIDVTKYYSLAELLDEPKINLGNLGVVLRSLLSMNLVEFDSERNLWRLSGKDTIASFPQDVQELLTLSKRDYLASSHMEGALVKWVDRSLSGWGIVGDSYFADFCDGLLIIPLLIHLRAGEFYCVNSNTISLEKFGDALQQSLVNLFVDRQWGKAGQACIALSSQGVYLISRILNAGTVMSYAPMLKQMDVLLFGEPALVFTRDPQSGHENHIERTLNVVASGFQHEKYFKDIENTILSIFDTQNFQQQPSYIADMGCGDGSLLKQVYSIIQNKSARGRVLNQFPVTLIGVDYNDKALVATAQTLQGLPHITIHGDIGDPSQLENDLQSRVSNVADIIHIRSFLDHDRPFLAPSDSAACENKRGIDWELLSVDTDGDLIEPAIAMQSLVEHLGRWANLRTKHGMLVLEVHSVPPDVAGEYMDECESLHFDAYHAFSRQHLVGAEHFSIAASEAGLFPDISQSRYYSKILPFKRITLNMLQKQPFSVRYASLEDLAALSNLQSTSTNDGSELTRDRIEKLILRYPQGQYVCLQQQKIVAACYTWRKHQSDVNNTSTDQHGNQISGALVNILGLALRAPVDQVAELFVNFVCYNSQLKSGVEEVLGQQACLDFIQQRAQSLGSENTFASVVVGLAAYEKHYPVDASRSTIDAEIEVATFAARRLLQWVQIKGFMLRGRERYNVAQIIVGLGIEKKYHRLFRALLNALARRKVLRIEGDEIITLDEVEHFALRNFDQEAQVFEQQLTSRYPSIAAFWQLTKRCLCSYGEVLSGARDSNDVVFEDGSMELFAQIFKGNPVADYYNELLAESIVAMLVAKRAAGDASEFRVLEIGAGTGGATEFVLRKLAEHGTNITFYYTDISSSFTRYGRERFAQEYPWVCFSKLDIGKDPQQQGFEKHSFDTVFAFNVLHDTEVIHSTLAWINQLLKTNGVLLMNEYTRVKDMLLFSGGLLHGLWIYKDPEKRIESSCFLSVKQWQQVANETGYADFAVFGDPYVADPNDSWQSVMLCHKTDNVLPPSALGDLTRNEKNRVEGLAPIDARESEVSELGYELILKQVLDAISRIHDHPQQAAIASDSPIMEMGLDSLELVELKSLLNKIFSLKLSTSVFFSMGTAEKISRHISQLTAAKKASVPLEKSDSAVAKPELCLATNNLENAQTYSVETGSDAIAARLSECLKTLRMQLSRLEHEGAIGKMDADVPIMEMGFDSIELVELRSLVNKAFGLGLATSVFFKFTTLNALATHIVELTTRDAGTHLGPGSTASYAIVSEYNHAEPTQKSRPSEKNPFLQKNARASGSQSAPRKKDIAIIGLALNFPGEVNTRAQLWDLLSKGDNAVRPLSEPRWLWPESVDIDGHDAYLKYAGFVSGIDRFDADFFRISPKEAELMDPQQRMVMQLTWQALEDAGYKASQFRGSKTGVYIGACHFDYAELAKHREFRDQAYVSTGINSSLLANRVSYFFDLQGPSMMIDTACSSSLVAVHEAVEALRRGNCEQAIVGGVNLICTPTNTLVYDKANILSKNSRCAAFDADANGFVRGEGGAIFVLKPLEQAVSDGDSISGVIKGVAVNHGGQSTSLTAPNPDAQAKLITQALKDADAFPSSIGYVEAHGTGTALGDPVEVLGLNQAFTTDARSSMPLASVGLGTIKSNIGHLEGAAGVAGMMKVLLSLSKKQLPATLHYKNLNPEIELENTPFYIVDSLRPWAAPSTGLRRAGVSSFGFGGANGHVILEEYQAADSATRKEVGGPHALLFSAKQPESLLRYVENFKHFVTTSPENLHDIAYSLSLTREPMACRVALVADDKEHACHLIDSYLQGHANDKIVYCQSLPGEEEPTGVFKGKAGQQLVRFAIESQSVELIAQAWAGGVNADFSALYRDSESRRVRIPVYQFAGEKYWLYPQELSSNAVKKNIAKAFHLEAVSSSRNSTRNENIFSASLDGSHPIFADHIINNVVVCPGVVAIELMLAALQRVWPNATFTLHDMIWRQPIVLLEGRHNVGIQVTTDQAGEVSCRVFESGNSAQGNYCQVKAVDGATYIPLDDISVTSVQQRLSPRVQNEEDIADFYGSFVHLNIAHGRYYQCIKQLWVGEDELLARIVLEQGPQGEAFTLHPALADAALQMISGTLSQHTSTALLPFSVDTVKVLSKASREIFVYGKKVSLNRYDLSLVHKNGQRYAEFRGLNFRPYTPGGDGDDSDTYMLTPVWQRDPVAELSLSEPATENAKAIAFATGTNTVLASSLFDPRNSYYAAMPSEPQINANQDRCVNFETPEAVRAFLETVETFDRVYLCVAAEDAYAVTKCFNLLHALTDLVSSAQVLDIVIAVYDTQSISALGVVEAATDKPGTVNPSAAGIIGLAQCFSQEYRRWRLRIVDFASYEEADLMHSSAGAKYLQQVVNHSHQLTAFRSGQVYTQNLAVLEHSTPAYPCFKHQGIYLVVGGSGGVGLKLSRYLIEQYDATLIWIGRRAPDDEIQAKQSDLADLGVKPYYIQADVTDRLQMEEALEKIKSRFGRLNAAFHSAAQLHDQVFTNMDIRSFLSVYHVKEKGSQVLGDVLSNEDLDFVCFFSSIRSFFPEVGQSNYAAGCTFQDAFAAELRARVGYPVFLINWGYWEASGLAQGYQTQLLAQGLTALTLQQSMAALEAALFHGHQHALIFGAKKSYLDSFGLAVGPTENLETNATKYIDPNRESSAMKPVDRDDTNKMAEGYLVDLVSASLKLPKERIFLTKSFEEYGIDSMMIIDLTQSLEKTFGKLPKSLFFEYRNLKQLSAYFGDNHQGVLSALVHKEASDNRPKARELPEVVAVPTQKIRLAHAVKRSQAEASRVVTPPEVSSIANDIAIIGVGGRYPQANNLDVFWENLKSGKDCITEIPASRWDFRPLYEQGKINSKWGGFIEDADKFDPLFFNISPREAERIDPQERLFLETVWQTMEDAGYTRARMSEGSRHGYGANVGVYVGVMYEEYKFLGVEHSAAGETLSLSGHPASIANRISYHCDFRGPSMAVDTMCSSSLTAIHLACASLRAGECDYAFAGGVNLNLHADKYIYLAQGQFSSSDGRCRSFADGGDGFVPSEGVGAVLLKPLAKAIADGDQIYAVIKGSAVNHGGKTNGYTVPDPVAQGELITDAMNKAGVSATDFSYIETHGTGTPLGDPVELAGLSKAFSELGDGAVCAIGSVKSNVGHCESAAGIAAVTKVLLQLKYKQLVPSIHSETLNSNIDFDSSPFKVQQNLEPWPQKNGTPRLAGISSFGAGGANAHVIVQEYLEALRPKSTMLPSVGRIPVLLSARTLERLRAYVQALYQHIQRFNFGTQEYKADYLRRVSKTLLCGRETLQARVFFLSATLDELATQLAGYLADEGQRENVYTGFIDNVVEAEESLARDLDSKNIIDRAQEVRDIETLAQYWVSGAKIEWADFGGFFDKSIITVSLPTYPFLRKRYWVDVVGNGVKSSDTELSTRARASGDTPVLHPLIHENISSFAKQCFRSKFTGEEFFFTDHIVGGSPILPGSAYIEMVRYCLDNSLQECEKLSFENIVFKEPLRSTCLKELDVHTTLFADLENENAFSFEVVSIAFDEPTRVHAQGQVLVGGQFIHSDPQPLDLKAIKSRCNDVKESTEVYAKFSEMGFSYGPKFSVINAIYFNDSEALAKLALADVIDSLDDVFTIHPGMLDGALQSLVPLLADSTIYVPFNIGKLTVTHKIPKRVYAYAKMQTHTTEKSPQFLSFDVTLCDDNGRVLLSVKDIVYRALKGEKNTNADDSYHQHDIHLVCPKWQPKTQLETNQTLNAPILVVANSPSHIDALVEQIKSKHDCPIIAIIASADAHPKHSLHFDLVDMSSKHGLVSLLSKMKFENRFPGTVIVGFSSDTESMKYTSEVSDLLDCVCQSLSAVGIPKPLNIVSYYGYSSGVPAPRFSAISAYLKVFQSEHANVRYKTLAIHSGRNSLQLVTEELNANSVSEQLRFPETGDRQLMSYHPISLDVSAELNSPKSILRTRGVYLITGGAGGIGESLAYYLCREYSAKVLLIGRSDICESKKALIQNLKAIGGDAQYFKCDINRIEDIYAVLAITDDQFGQINGVMHCAGVAGTSLIKNKQKSISTEILKPKTIGLENLDLATKDVELDFFTQFSSTSALFGDGGLSDYAYANAYMDAFSELRQKAVVEGLRHGKSISINWPYWLSGGMQVEKHVENVMLDLYGLQSIGKNEALSLFEKITKLNINNLAVLPGNKEKILGVLNALDTRVQAGVEHVPSDRKALSASKTGLNRHISSVLIEMVQNILKLDKEDVSISEELKNYGFESVSFAQFSSQINAKWGLSINPTVFFECHTLTALAHYLSESFGQKFENTDDLDRQLHTIAAGNEISKLSEQVEDTTFIGAGGPHQASKSEAVDDPVVIVGMSGIMPQSRNLNEFWESLIQGRSLISEVPGARWNWKDYYGDAINNPSKTNSKWGGFIDDVDAFDPAFFNLSVTEAEVMDPQHRLFLQEAWRCIEDAGYAPSSLSGAKVAVYVGMQFQEYQALMQRHSGSMTAHMATGNAHSILPNRVSYLLNLRGPSEAIDTACSSSLVAIHRAVNSLLSGEVDAAIAGGVSLALSPETFVLTSQMGAFSADGQCKTFDKSANGYVKGEGVGAVYLKRMSVAKKDGDQIYAVIKSSAVNHGGKSQSLTAPNSDAQAELLVDAYRKAEVDPRSIDFIETHGTGTELGDPIEVQGLKRAFDILFKDRPISDAGDAKIALGAVKTNTGHLEPAAGMAGLFKILLSMKHGLIPKNINFTEQNPFIELDDSPFYILNQVKNWPVRIDRHGEKIPRRAGLSSFGFGGVNAHLVVEDFAAKAEENLADHSSDTSEKLILLSAKTETALEAMVNDLHIFVTDEKNSINLNALAYTLQCGRENMTCRLCVHVTSVDQLIESLKALSVDLSNSNRSRYTSLNDRDISGGDLVAAVGKCSSDLARLWLEGANIDWQTLYRSPYPTRLHLPTYRFDLNRYWFKEINEKHPLKSFDAPLDALSKNTNLAFSGARHRVRPSKPALNRFSLVSPQWKKFSAVSSLTRAGIPSKIETIFIFSDDAAFARMIEESRPGLRVVLFHSHPLLQNTVSQAFEVSDYSNRNQIDQAFAAIIASNIYPDMVVVDIPSVKWDEKIVENKSIHTVVIQAVYICQNISRYLHSNSIDLFFINAHESMASQPQISALSGFIKCFRLEDDRIKTCLIEVVFDNSEKYSAKKTEFLSLEASISDADEVKYFENARWLVSQKKIDVTHEAARLSGNKSIFTENGVYLLSGGAGGLGQIFSEHIASGLQNVTIVMLGRNTPDKSLLTQLQKNNPGSRVEFVQADVSKLSEVRFSVRNIEQKFGRINGVIHCAGVLSDKLVKNKNAHHIDTVVQPKIYGALNLDEATQHCDLDFMMYCSSLSALVGNAGQSVYAYSNRFLDIFAQYRNDLVSRGLRKGNTQSINWPLWKDGGMSIDDSILNDIENFRGFLPISRVEGIRIFDTMIVSGLESAYPFIERAHDFPNENENSPYMPESRAELGEGPEHNAGKVQTNSAPMATVVDVEITPNVEDNIPKVIDYLQQKISLIVKSDVAIDAAFEASGIDSFLSIKLLNELENDIGRLRKTLLFEFFTIEMLSKYLIDNHYLRLSGMLDFSVFKRLHPRELDKPKVVETLGVAVAATLPNSSESGNQVVDTHLFDKALGLVVSIFSEALKAKISEEDTFTDAGVDSFLSINVLRKLEDIFGTLRKTLLFEFFTPKTLTRYFVDHHLDVIEGHFLNLKSEFEKIGERAGVAEQSVERGCILLREQELEADPELRSVYIELINRKSNEGIVARAASLITPYVFIGASRSAIFRVNIHAGNLLAWPYVGPESEFELLTGELTEFAEKNSLEPHILSTTALNSVNSIQFTSTPFGAIQQIVGLDSFHLTGKPMRKLRYAVNKFAQAGELNFVEYRIGTERTTDLDVVNMIDQWCEIKTQINPCVTALKRDIESGSISDEHRVFLTYLNSSLANVILITKMSTGYLMDMEFYPKGSTYGSLEYSICQIIERLNSEGCPMFSLGGTYGPEIITSPNADEGMRSILNHLRETGDFSQGNLQFKNKFRTRNTPIYVCKPVGGDPSKILDILMLIADPSDSGPGNNGPDGDGSVGGSKPLLRTTDGPDNVKVLSGKSIAAGAEAETDARATLLEKNGYNPALVAPESIDYDLFTDSWLQLKTDYVAMRVKHLNCNTVDDAVDIDAQLKKVFAFEYVLAVPSGRKAETILYKSWPSEKKQIVQNLLFPTGIFTQLDEGFQPVEFPFPQVLSLRSSENFRGGLDSESVDLYLQEHADKAAMLCVELANNASGGYPVSIDNLEVIKSLSQRYGIPLVLDVTRILDNAIFIQRSDDTYKNMSLWDITHKICSFADCITGSLGKNFCVPVGGFVAVRDSALFDKVKKHAQSSDYLLSVEQQKIVTRGLQDIAYIEQQVVARVDAVRSVWVALKNIDMPVMSPAGGHCVLIDVSQIPAFFKNSEPQSSFIAWLYRETGVRAGIHNAGMKKNTVLNRMVRLAVPVGLPRKSLVEFTETLVSCLAQCRKPFDLELVEKPVDSYGHMRSRFKRVSNYSSVTETQNSTQANIKESLTPLYADDNASDKTVHSEDVAIVGLAGRYPMAGGIEEFWENLKAGRDCISEIPSERLELIFQARSDQPLWGGYVDGIDKFDAEFFNIHPRDAKHIDPQERLFLETAWHALEDAGYYPESLIDTLGTNKIGVYAGVVWSQYHMLALDNNFTSQLSTQFGVANRVSYFMNFSGPSLTLNSACTSSLNAFKLACDAISSKQIQAAIVGGVNLDIHASKQHALSAGKSLSSSGRCRSFGKGADGYVTGEGVGAIVLKPLSQAIRDNDNVYAVIKSIASSHTGASSGYGIPNPSAQTEIIAEALKNAKVTANSISYIEAHGTGTELGDSIEVLGLSNALNQNKEHKNQWCSIGSVKSSIGHLEAAAGIAGITKVALQFRHKQLVPSLHSAETNELIEFKESPLYVQQENSAWETNAVKTPLRAGLNAFADGGSNVHVIFEEYHSKEKNRVDESRAHIFPLSANSQASLEKYVFKLAEFLRTSDTPNVCDIAYTLQLGRKPMRVRAAFSATSVEELVSMLERYDGSKQSFDTAIGPSKSDCCNGDIQSYLLSGNSEKLIEAWLGGARLNWKNIYKDARPSRISLPNYPFVRQSHWLDSVVEQNNVGHSLRNADYIPPKTGVEEKLANIWEEVLGIGKGKLGAMDSFFEVGGDSLSAVTVISKIRQEFDRDFPMTSLFAHPTVRASAEALEALPNATFIPAIKQIGKVSCIPQSFAQKSLWLIDQINGPDDSYNIGISTKLSGELDVDSLTNAFAQIIQGNDVFRTTFTLVSGTPVQLIADKIEFSLPVVAVDEDLVDGYVASHFKEVFDLVETPLISVKVFRVAPDQHVLSINIHHIIFDAWSLGLLCGDINRLYRGELLENRSALQYKDYSVWQQHVLTPKGRTSKWLDSMLDYWEEYLKDGNYNMALPYDSDEIPENVKGIGAVQRSIDEQFTLSLRMFAVKNNATLFTTFFSTLSILMSRWCNCDDVILGTVVAGRNSIESESMFGCFMNFLALRARVDQNLTIEQFVKSLSTSLLESLSNQECPFEKIVERINPKTRSSRSPLYNVSFRLQNMQIERLELPGLIADDMSVTMGGAQLDLMFEVIEKESALILQVQYDKALFHEETITTLLTSFEFLLKQLPGSGGVLLKDMGDSRYLHKQAVTQGT